MMALDAREVAAAAAAATGILSFADDLLERLQRAVGYDVAYHAYADGAAARFAARRGFSDDAAALMLRATRPTVLSFAGQARGRDRLGGVRGAGASEAVK